MGLKRPPMSRCARPTDARWAAEMSRALNKKTEEKKREEICSTNC